MGRKNRKPARRVSILDILPTLEVRRLDGIFFGVVATPTIVRVYGWPELERIVRNFQTDTSDEVSCKYHPRHFVDPRNYPISAARTNIPLTILNPYEIEGRGLLIFPTRIKDQPILAMVTMDEFNPKLELAHDVVVRPGHQRAISLVTGGGRCVKK